jgi:hypothetical protein
VFSEEKALGVFVEHFLGIVGVGTELFGDDAAFSLHSSAVQAWVEQLLSEELEHAWDMVV